MNAKNLNNNSKILIRAWSLALLALLVIFSLPLTGCSSDPTGTSGTSASGYTMALRANPGELRADGSSTALVMVEVWDENGNYVDAETVTFSTTLGALANATVTTTNGVAINTFTSSTSEGMAVIAAAVENIVAKAEIVQFYTNNE